MTKINPFHMYILEQEGYLSTRESKLRKVVKKIRAYPAETLPQSAFNRILRECGIEPSSLTPSELSKIQSAIK